VPATNVVLRRRIVDRLASATDARITVILAPAGYGKSTAVQQFIATRSNPHIIFSARPDDKALIGFARGLLESSPLLSRLALPSLNGAYASAMRAGEPGHALAEWLMMFLRELPADTLIAIDDAQFGNDDPQTTRFVAALVDGTKDPVKWLIALRSAHDLPLGEWLAQGEMELPLDSVDLAFTAGDLRNLVGAMGLTGVAESVLDQSLPWTDGLLRYFSPSVQVSPSLAFRRPGSQPTISLHFLPTAFSRRLVIASAPSSRLPRRFVILIPHCSLRPGLLTYINSAQVSSTPGCSYHTVATVLLSDYMISSLHASMRAQVIHTMKRGCHGHTAFANFSKSAVALARLSNCRYDLAT
jgi:hypothetical protein